MTDLPENVNPNFDSTGSYLEPKDWAIPEDVMKAAKAAIDDIEDAIIDRYNENDIPVAPEVLLARVILAERERQAAYIRLLETMNMRGVPSGDEVAVLDAALARDRVAPPNPPSAFGGHRPVAVSRA